MGTSRRYSAIACKRDRQHRHQPRLAALAGDAQHGFAGAGEIAGGKAERFGNAQAGAVEQASAPRRCARRSRAPRRVARPPRRRVSHPPRSAAWAAISVVSARAARQRRRRWRGRAVRESAGTNGRRPARAPACGRPRPRAAAGEKGAQVGGPQIRAMSAMPGGAAAMAGEKLEELAGVALIGVDGQRGQPPFACRASSASRRGRREGRVWPR